MKSSSESMLRVVVVGVTTLAPCLSLSFSSALSVLAGDGWCFPGTLRSSGSVLGCFAAGADLIAGKLSSSPGVVVAASSTAFLFLVMGGVVKVLGVSVSVIKISSSSRSAGKVRNKHALFELTADNRQAATRRQRQRKRPMRGPGRMRR